MQALLETDKSLTPAHKAALDIDEGAAKDIGLFPVDGWCENILPNLQLPIDLPKIKVNSKQGIVILVRRQRHGPYALNALGVYTGLISYKFSSI